MGEPRQPTPSDRAAVRAQAKAILSSITADEEMALDLGHQNTPGGRMVYLSDVEDLLSQFAAEVVALESERTRLRAAIWAVIDMFDGASYNFRNRDKGGQHVPYHGDFASMPPSAASQMDRWSRDLRMALADKWPMNREEWTAMFPQTDSAALDEMFKERTP